MLQIIKNKLFLFVAGEFNRNSTPSTNYPGSGVSALTLDEAKAIAQLHPDIINPEPSEIIGGGKGASPMAYVMDSIKAIKAVDPSIMVEQAAGITCGQEVYDFIMAGSEAAGAASGIMNAADPIAMIDEMIGAVRRAADDLAKKA